MADAITQALTDLTAAITNVQTELTALVAIVKADTTASAESQAAAASIENLVTGLNTAVSAAQAATTATPPPPPPTAPVVTSIASANGSINGGDTVVITGTGLTGASAVNFGTVAATSFTADSDTQVTAVSPVEDAGTVDVTVVTPDGTSATSAADQFTAA